MADLERLLTGYLAPVFYDGAYGFLRLFWYFALFEFPRFVLTDLVVFIRRFEEWRRPWPPCRESHSVVVPVLNEQDTIEATVRSLEEQSAPPRKIIIVNDGSTDGTSAVCRELCRRSAKITFLEQGERAGKSATLNRGLSHVQTEFVVFVDSDSTFDRDAIANLLRRFHDPQVVAVGGSLRARNRNATLLTEAQALEYGLSITLARQSKAELDILPIVSGAFGAFRTGAVRAAGGHDPGPGNDSDLTIDLRNQGGRIEFAHDAVCHTDVPTSLPALTRQRRRWSRNVVKNRLRKHLNLFSPTSRNFSLRNLASTLDPILYQFVFSWIWLIYLLHTAATMPHLIVPIMLGNWLLYYLSATVQQSVVVLLSERPKEDLAGFLFLPVFHLYRIYHRCVMMYAHLEELFTRTSLRDPFAPKKVRRAMPDW